MGGNGQCVLYELFPKPVGRYPYPRHTQLKPCILEQCRRQTFFKGTGPKSHTKLGTSEVDLLNTKDPELNRFYTSLTDHANHFAYGILGLEAGAPMILISLWINVVHGGANEARHHHANAIVSGTYYLNFTPAHARLRFYAPRPTVHEGFSLELQRNPDCTSKYGWGYTEIQDVTEGDLLLWPSYLDHGYQNNGADNRIAVSMNFMPACLSSDYSFKVSRNTPSSKAAPGRGDTPLLSDDVLRDL